MAWTAPRTWVAGETVTAAIMNTHVRDNFKALGDPMTAYTPTLVGLTLGTGTMVAKWQSIGKIVILRVTITAGGTTSTTAAVTISLPVAGSASSEQQLVMKVSTGAVNYVGHADILASATVTRLWIPQAAANCQTTPMSNTSPNIGTAGNLVVQGTYESA